MCGQYTNCDMVLTNKKGEWDSSAIAKGRFIGNITFVENSGVAAQ